MHSTPIRTAVLAILLAATGCISPRSFVAPALPTTPKATAQELVKGSAVVALEFTFTTNGKPNAKVTDAVREMVVDRMAALGVARVAATSAEPTACTLRIHMDSIADTGAAWGKGFKTGFTFGLAGSTVDDGYQFDVSLERTGRPAVQKSYRHLITTMIGSGANPPGVAEMTPAQAVSTVVEDLVITMLRDLQREGLLVPSAVPAT